MSLLTHVFASEFLLYLFNCLIHGILDGGDCFACGIALALYSIVACLLSHAMIQI